MMPFGSSTNKELFIEVSINFHKKDNANLINNFERDIRSHLLKKDIIKPTYESKS